MDGTDVITEFRKRQKRIALAACACFALMVPLTIWARSVHPYAAIIVILAFIFPMVAFYIATFRCPACGKLVKQRRRMLRMPIRCAACNVVLDPN